MYKVTYISGGSNSIVPVLQQSIENINRSGGVIVEMLQSQSSSSEGFAVVTITILWREGR
jgi:hypothetical protein